MQQNFAACLALVLKSEGGKVDDPRDPGGRTNQGITQAVFNQWLANHGSEGRDVYTIMPDEVGAIYRANYWTAVNADSLPSGIDYAVFDFGVNSGPKRAATALQTALGVPVDGIVGPVTIAASVKAEPAGVIAAICAGRLAFLKTLSTWPTFGVGWASRVASVRSAALTMTAPVKPSPVPFPPLPRPTPAPIPTKPPAVKSGGLAGIVAAIIAFILNLLKRSK